MLNALVKRRRTVLEQEGARDRIDGHAAIARSLRQLGVSHVYGISGMPVHETFAACAKSGIRPIAARHQQAAVMMAAAHNYISGRLSAVAMVSAGPAVTNAATGILVAYDNGWPLVVLGGRHPLSMDGKGYFQELDAVPVFRSIVKFAATVSSTSEIQPTLQRAFQIAMSGNPGPAYLDLPEEALRGTTSLAANFPDGSKKPIAGADDGVHANTCPVSETAIAEAVALLRDAERPAIIIGDAARWSEPFAELDRLVRRLNAPFITSPMAHGYLPTDDPLYYNHAKSFLLSTADVVLVIGAKLDWTFRFGAEITRSARLIHIDIDAQGIGANVAPTVSMTGDIKHILIRLLDQFDQLSKPYISPVSRDYGASGNAEVVPGKQVEKTLDSRVREKDNLMKASAVPAACQKNDRGQPWRRELAEKRRAQIAQYESLGRDDRSPMTAHRLVAEIREWLPRDAIVIADGNAILAAAQQLLPAHLPVSRFTPGSNGCLGVGIPFGIAARLAHPERLVIVICGDAAFGFNAMEMETAVRLRVSIIVVVANNEGNGGARHQKALYPHDYPDRVTMFQPGIRYEQIMQAFGGYAEFVEHPGQVGPALGRAADAGVAACINVAVTPN